MSREEATLEHIEFKRRVAETGIDQWLSDVSCIRFEDVEGGKMSDENNCQLCGGPMPRGEEMFNYHGYSGPCPKPPLECCQPDRDKHLLAMLEPEIIYYGPHACEECGKIICRSSRSQGPEHLRGFSFDYPDGPIYPNTNWTRHDCSKTGEPATEQAQATRRLPREER